MFRFVFTTQVKYFMFVFVIIMNKFRNYYSTGEPTSSEAYDEIGNMFIIINKLLYG